MQYQIIKINPALAKIYLKNIAPNQRNLSQAVVERYAREMSNSQWKVSQPICIDIDGQIIDGQHRLNAVILANKEVEFLIVEGMPKESINYIDIGKNRTTKDLARLQDLSCSKIAFSVLNCCFMCPSREIDQPVFNKTEQIQIYLRHKEAIEFVGENCKTNRYAPHIAPVARAWYTKDRNRLKEFLSVYQSGYAISENTKKDDAAIALRNRRLNSVKASSSAVRRFEYRSATNALNHFLKGSSIRLVRDSNINHFPVLEFDNYWIDRQFK